MASWRWRSKRAALSAWTGSEAAALHFARGSLDQITAPFDAGEFTNRPHHRAAIAIGVAVPGKRASHRVADDAKTVAAVKSLDHGRQNGFVERTARHQAVDA